VIDHILHVVGGALLATPLIVFGTQSPIVTFFVFSAWGLLREQAQRNVRGAGFKRNWLDIWNMNKLSEGISWGVGSLIAHAALGYFGT